MKKISTLVFSIVVILLFNACQKDHLSTQTTSLGLQFHIPAELTAGKLSNIELNLKEINSGLETILNVAEGQEINTLPYGSYNATIEADIDYELDGKLVKGKVKAYKTAMLVKSESTSAVFDVFLSNDDANFVFKEIFFTGTVTPEGKQYNGDKYFIIYNNSDSVLYADGLFIAQSTFLTTNKIEYVPNVMNEAVTASQMIMVPGDGDDYPIQPGEQFVIANNAINHLEYNSRSLDLTLADFEIDMLASVNVDNPSVTNMTNVLSAIFSHNRGFQSYVMGRFPAGMSTDDYKSQNYYSYTYLNAAGRPITANSYKIPNAFILDAVNLSVQASFEWIVTSPQLDMGWTHVGSLASDPERYGKSVTRKVLSKSEDGKDILKDTNNSAADFDAETALSLKK